jgi:hypothetical protein
MNMMLTTRSIRLLFATGLFFIVATQLLSRYIPIPDLVLGTFMGIGIGVEIIALVKFKKFKSQQS